MQRSIENVYARPREVARWQFTVIAVAALALISTYSLADEISLTENAVLHVALCNDFDVNGKGDSPEWKRSEWTPLNRRPGGQLDYRARFKMMYSDTGIYVLFDGTDRRLTATLTEDFQDLWTEDVYECFFWTDQRHPVYFEYEISPLGYELPILIPNLGGTFLGWRPWHYEAERRTRKQVSIAGGKQEPHAPITGWQAEVFFPYDLFKPLGNVPPKRGTQWRANFYRVDHDQKPATAWDWARVGASFHEFQDFGTIIFD